MTPEMKRMEEQCVFIFPSICGQFTDHHARFLPYNFRNTVVERSHVPSSDVTAVPHRPVTPCTPVIDRGFESMIDHKSIINQRMDTPVGGYQDDKDFVESHVLNPISPSLPNGDATSERTDNTPGKLQKT